MATKTYANFIEKSCFPALVAIFKHLGWLAF